MSWLAVTASPDAKFTGIISLKTALCELFNTHQREKEKSIEIQWLLHEYPEQR